jgi:hypothetical protein
VNLSHDRDRERRISNDSYFSFFSKIFSKEYSCSYREQFEQNTSTLQIKTVDYYRQYHEKNVTIKGWERILSQNVISF